MNARKTEYTRSSVIMLQDIAFSMLATLLAILIVRWLSRRPIYNFETIVIGSILFSGIFSFIAFEIKGTHKVIVRHSSIMTMEKFIIAALIKEFLLGSVYALHIIYVPAKMGLFIILSDFLLMMVIILTTRILSAKIYGIGSIDPSEDIHKQTVLVCGTSDESVALDAIIGIQNQYLVLGFLSTNKALDGSILGDRKVFFAEEEKDINKICWLLGGVDCVVFPHKENEKYREMIDMCLDLGIQVLHFPDIDSFTTKNSACKTTEELKQIDSDYIPDAMSDTQLFIKRAFDIAGSGLLLILFSPLFLFCWIAIRKEDRGSAIYRQERIGRLGKPFNIYKFRSMRTDAESSGPALYSGEHDSRLTQVGKFLRKHHLDELPQLWNVFKGDMSFIGYRPERKYYINKIMEKNPRYKYLYQIRPGVTSYATLYNGYTDSLEKMLRRLDLDLYYLAHRSIAFDLRILWNTFTNIVFGKIF